MPPAFACGVKGILSGQNGTLISEQRSPSYTGLETSKSVGKATCQNGNDQSDVYLTVLCTLQLSRSNVTATLALVSLAVHSLGRATDKQIASQPQRMLVLGSGLAFVLAIKPGGICRASHISARCDWYFGLTSFFRKVGAQSYYLLPGLIASCLGLILWLSPLAEVGEGSERK